MPRGYGAGGYMYAPPPPHHAYAHHPPPPPHHGHPGHDERYDQHPHPHAHPHYAQGFPIQHAGYVPYPLPGTILSAPMAPPQSNGANPNGAGGGVIQVVHTDDAATKLSDRVRRRCFNCCTTDTSTWRRSNLSPGKVLCNKCGLFERTHSRPRPEQFPHKRGPLASSTLRSRSPPPGQGQPSYQQPHYAPPPSASSASAPPPSQSSAQPYIAPLAPSSQQNGSASHPSTPAPPHTNGSSAANGTGESPRLPGVDSWAPANGERRSASPRERDERREERREERRDERREDA
ncbi:hypothetical protein FB451DRAFT_1300479 [Mycena latifolia]|nr:hypothetical protein FB451DRAFT_1300479 [Mycena latifolia]